MTEKFPAVGGFGLGRERFALLFTVMLVAAAGNTAMQSLLPSIGRDLGVPDIWVAIAFSLSALLWVVAAPYWAHRADRRGRRVLMRMGLYGFIISMLICGLVLAAGLSGGLSPLAVFVVFCLGRGLYGALGSASPPGVQAYVAARTEGSERTNALSAIASSFGLGSVVGPALAPLFIFGPLGLSTPLIVFAGFGVAVLAWLAVRLPDDTPRSAATGAIAAYPAIGDAGAAAPEAPTLRPKLAWRDPRVLPWHIIGLVGGHGHAMLLGVIGFLVLDRVEQPPDEAQQAIAIVLMAGAVASLFAQWWLIPRLTLSPRQLVLWGGLVAAVGTTWTGWAADIHALSLSFALASVGFGLFRPGFTSGASLAVELDEQNAVAGMVTSINGAAYLAAPTIGIALYGLSMPAPFVATALVMLGLSAWTLHRVPGGAHVSS